MVLPIVRDFDNLAANIANPPPDRPIARGVGNFGRKVCDRVSARPDLFAPTILQYPIRAVCQPYWDGAGISPPEQAPPPFLGGQCDGASYTIAFDFAATRCSDGGTSTFSPGTTTRTGPITRGIVITNINSTTERADFRIAGKGQSLTSGFTSVGTLNYLKSCGGGTASITAGRWGNFTVTRNGGLPDNCGDPPSPIQPGPNPAPDPGPLPPDTGPQFDIRGNPIFVFPPTLEVSPNINIELSPGEINLGSGTGNNPPVPPEAGGDIPGAGSGSGGGENDFPEPPNGERWVGCCINITTSPVGQGEVPQSLPHPIYLNTVGNARLKFQAGESPIIYDSPVLKRQESTCLWEPTRGLNPVGVFVNLLPGFSYSVTPYSVPLEQ